MSYVLWSDPRFELSLVPEERAAYIVTSPGSAGRLTRPEVTFETARFRHIGDPLLGPEVDSYPRQVTELVETQTLTLFCLDQRVPLLTLTSVVVTGDGISLTTGQTSGRFITGSIKEYTLTLDTTNSAVSGEIRWQFAERDDYVIPISAGKTSIWPYPPMYPIKEAWNWSTSIIETKEAEQRLGNAEFPLQKCSYDYYLPRKQAEQLNVLFEELGQSAIKLPMWVDAIHSVSVSVGSARIDVAPGLINFVGDAVLYHSSDDYEIIHVVAQDTTGLDLSKAVEQEHVNASLIPLSPAIAPDGLSVEVDGRYRKQSVDFYVLNPLELEAQDWALTLLGLPVLNRYRKGKKLAYTSNITETITSANQRTYNSDRYVIDSQWTIELIEQDIPLLKRRLYAFKGRLNLFWLMSSTNDVALAKASAKSELHVIPNYFNQRFQNGVYLALQYAEALEMVRAIPNGVDEDGNEILLIEKADAVQVSPEDLLSGHIMTLVRSESDEWEFNIEKQLVSMSLNLREVSEDELDTDS